MTLIDPFVAVIPAAGVGKRLGSKESKQYLLLRGQSILESSIKPLLTLSECKGICIVISSEDSHWRSLDISTRDNISFIEGGLTRIKSSMNGINFWLTDDPYVPPSNTTRIQLASAIGILIPNIISFGVLKPKHFLGRLLSLAIMLFTRSGVKSSKLVPFGRYCRINQFVFSLSPRSHEW